MTVNNRISRLFIQSTWWEQWIEILSDFLRKTKGWIGNFLQLFWWQQPEKPAIFPCDDSSRLFEQNYPCILRPLMHLRQMLLFYAFLLILIYAKTSCLCIFLMRFYISTFMYVWLFLSVIQQISTHLKVFVILILAQNSFFPSKRKWNYFYHSDALGFGSYPRIPIFFFCLPSLRFANAPTKNTWYTSVLRWAPSFIISYRNFRPQKMRVPFGSLPWFRLVFLISAGKKHKSVETKKKAQKCGNKKKKKKKRKSSRVLQIFLCAILKGKTAICQKT